MVAQQFVALLQGTPVTYEMVEIERVCLRDHLIHETAPLLPRAAHKLLVGRRHKHQRVHQHIGEVYLMDTAQQMDDHRARCRILVALSLQKNM